MKKSLILILAVITLMVVLAGCTVSAASIEKTEYDLSESSIITTNASKLSEMVFLTHTENIVVHFGEEGISGKFYIWEEGAENSSKQSVAIDTAIDTADTPNSTVIQKSFSGLSSDKKYCISVEGVDDDTIVVISSK